MLNLETTLLNALLDRYERSRGFKENRSQQRRIQLQMYGSSKTDFPAYDIEDSSARTAINETAKKLAEQGVIELEWMRGQEGHILRRIALCPGALADVYHRTGRKPLAGAADLAGRKGAGYDSFAGWDPDQCGGCPTGTDYLRPTGPHPAVCGKQSQLF